MTIIHDGPIPTVPAGTYPAELVQVCKLHSVSPASLLDWSVGRYSVVLVLASGAKLRVPCAGEWKALTPRQALVVRSSGKA